jgi:hypothetical protein
MKTLTAVLVLALIVVTFILSRALYLGAYYNSSAVLTLLWVGSVALWIKSNSFLENEKESN